MQNLYHRTTTALLRNAAVTLLRGARELAQASRRLLADLVEHADVVDLHDEPVRTTPFLLVVVQGPVAVRGVTAADGAQPELMLRRGVYWADDAPLDAVRDREVELRADSPRPTYVVHLDEETLERLLRASPTLAAVEGFHRHFPKRREDGTVEKKTTRLSATELVWMALDPRVDAPLVAWTQLLVAAVGSQFGEPAGLATLGAPSSTLAVWKDSRWRMVRLPARQPTVADITAAFRAAVGEERPARLYFACEACPASLTTGAVGGAPIAGTFHRVVYICGSELGAIPHGLERYLQKALYPRRGRAREDGTILSSFVPCRVVPEDPRRGVSVLGTFFHALPRCGADGFRTLPLDEWPNGVVPGAMPVRAEHRCRKDECRLAIDTVQLREDWDAWQKGPRTRPFPATMLGLDAHAGGARKRRRFRDTIYRWARGVTNRRVGMALSGGGACAFRAVPLIEMLGERGVPIDLFSGASGGSLLGAYYCTDGIEGLNLARRHGWCFLLASLGASLWSGTLELQIDHDLEGTRVEDLEVVLLPVTTALGDPPVASVVVGGRLGEAVRASGSALLSFGPTRKGPLRYVDGATATMIPAKVLSDHGADLVLAVNCVPGPLHGNPFGDYMIGRIIYNLPFVSRLIDTWVGGSYLLTTASRMAGVDAQVYWEPSPVWDPLFEAPHFERADEIVANSKKIDGGAMEKVADLMQDLFTKLGR
jgi:predicted acylesterase/phospholipase RssA